MSRVSRPVTKTLPAKQCASDRPVQSECSRTSNPGDVWIDSQNGCPSLVLDRVSELLGGLGEGGCVSL
jgi:hypothetical protein